MLTKAEEDKLIEDGSTAIEDITSAVSLADIYTKFQECVGKLGGLDLTIPDDFEFSENDFTDPEDEQEVEFVLPLDYSYDGVIEDTDLYLIFNYSLETGLYSIFADVDFWVDEETS